MEQHNSITEITLMQCARCLTPRPPVRAPGFPIAKATATVWTGCGCHGHGGWLGRFPSSVSLLENALAFSGPFGRCLGVPSFGANGGAAGLLARRMSRYMRSWRLTSGLSSLVGAFPVFRSATNQPCISPVSSTSANRRSRRPIKRPSLVLSSPSTAMVNDWRWRHRAMVTCSWLRCFAPMWSRSKTMPPRCCFLASLHFASFQSGRRGVAMKTAFSSSQRALRKRSA